MNRVKLCNMNKKKMIRDLIRIKWIRALDLFQDLLFYQKKFNYFEKTLGNSSSTDIVSTPYCIIRKVFKNIKKGNDYFIDIGCGAGRVVAWTARKKLFSHYFGVEINEKAFSIAMKNTKRNKNISILKDDAFNLDLHLYNCFYMWKPMKKDKWIELISRIPTEGPNKTLILVNDHEIVDWMLNNTTWHLQMRASYKNIYGTRIDQQKSMFSIWQLNV